MTGAPTALGGVALRAPGMTLRLTTAHGALYRHSRGRFARRWFGSSILVLETVGRCTGALRAAPLVYLPDGDDLVVVPANAGAERWPAWWLNLRAAGEGIVRLGTERRRVRPVEVRGAEHARLWRRFAAVTPVDHYQRRTARPLPVIRLTRASHESLKTHPYNSIVNI